MSVQEQTTKVPEWLADMEFCHIDDGSLLRSMCGDQHGSEMCPVEYDGKAVCSYCGNPTCPRCAQLVAIEESMNIEHDETEIWQNYRRVMRGVGLGGFVHEPLDREDAS